MNNPDKFFEDLKKLRQKITNSVVYFPQFENKSDLTNHFYRACWYLPFKENVVEEVSLATEGGLEMAARPSFMAPSVSSTKHINTISSSNEYYERLANAKCVLLWDYPTEETVELFTKLGIRTFNVTTNDESVAEYGNYCKLMWQLTGPKEKNQILTSSHNRFKQKLAALSEKGYRASALFGTGPSVDLAFNYDFSKCFTHACNTVILSEELMNHIDPDFISAGDVVSHFGVSVYAHEYREKLFETLQNRDCRFLTTSQFGYLFMLHYPSVADKVLACDQRGFTPNYDLLNDWTLPCLDSVFNIHMAPTCSTYSDTIFVLGCDGKNPDEKLNEDFWQHSKQAQLHHLVDTGHQSHPVFDVHRKQSTWTGYQNSVMQTCGIGENLYGKSYYSLEPSFTVGLKERFIDKQELMNKFPFMLNEEERADA